MIKTETIVYRDQEKTYESFLAYDDAITTPRPGVMVCHAFSGLKSFEQGKAIELAKLGYVGFAADVYGQGIRANNPVEASKLMAVLNDDRALLLARVKTAWQQLKSFAQVDTQRIGAIGFCFGGKCVLDLARSGETANGLVSFHGLYDAPPIATAEHIKASVLILHGWDDPLAPPESVEAIAKELSQKRADWEMNIYGHTGHSFTNPDAKMPQQGMAFQPASNDKSWKRMQDFFQQVFT